MIYVQCHDHIPKFFNPLCTHNPKILFPELVPKLVHQIEHHFIYVIGEEHYSRSVLQRASRQCLSVQVIQIFLEEVGIVERETENINLRSPE